MWSLFRRKPEVITNSLGMKLKRVDPGSFDMGTDLKYISDLHRPKHRVKLTRTFYMSIHTVTWSDWLEVMGTPPWLSYGKNAVWGSDYPVTYIGIGDANSFCKKLSALERKKYRLPTEAEWEYVCRAGTSTMYSFGDDPTELPNYGWFKGNTQTPQPIGQKLPNPWGFFDMHGGVWERCSDVCDSYSKAPQTDPTGGSRSDLFPERDMFVIRGGAWDNEADSCTSVVRGGIEIKEEHRFIDHVGFRIVQIP